VQWLLQDAVAVWDYKTVAVYKIDSQDDRMSVELAGSFSCNTSLVCLFGLNVYAVEPGRVHVRNFQVNDAAYYHWCNVKTSYCTQLKCVT